MKSEIDLTEYICKFIMNKFQDKYNFKFRTQKFTLKQIITDILYLLKTGISYSNLRSNISKSNLNKHFLFLSKNNIFRDCYLSLLEKYFNKNKSGKLKYQYIDTSFIINQNGLSKNIARNKYYKNKKGYKISAITDNNGIPISILVKNGAVNDAKFIDEHFNNLFIVTNTDRLKKHNKYKQYMMADKGYDSKEFRQKCTLKGYQVIIPFNKRNTKDPNKIKTLNEKEKLKYKKRIKVENLFCWLKKNKRIKEINDKYLDSYISFLYLAIIKKLFLGKI